MGNCGSSLHQEMSGGEHGTVVGFGEDQEAERRSKALDKEIREYQRRIASEVKILLLGAGESGKTTVLKQMKVIHGIGFAPYEVEHYRQQVFMNLWDAMRFCLEAMQELNIRLEIDTNRDHLYLFEETPHLVDQAEFPQQYLQPMKDLWADAGVQSVARRSSECILPDSLLYFYSDLDRFFERGYTPTYDDVSWSISSPLTRTSNEDW